MGLLTSNEVWYVYGIVPASFSPATLPAGLDDTDVALERGDHVAALVSALPGLAVRAADARGE